MLEATSTSHTQSRHYAKEQSLRADSITLDSVYFSSVISYNECLLSCSHGQLLGELTIWLSVTGWSLQERSYTQTRGGGVGGGGWGVFQANSTKKHGKVFFCEMPQVRRNNMASGLMQRSTKFYFLHLLREDRGGSSNEEVHGQKEAETSGDRVGDGHKDD